MPFGAIAGGIFGALKSVGGSILGRIKNNGGALSGLANRLTDGNKGLFGGAIKRALGFDKVGKRPLQIAGSVDSNVVRGGYQTIPKSLSGDVKWYKKPVFWVIGGSAAVVTMVVLLFKRKSSGGRRR